MKTYIVRALGVGFAIALTLAAPPVSAKWLEHGKTHLKFEVPDDNWKVDQEGELLRITHEKDPVFVFMDALDGGPADAKESEQEASRAIKRVLSDIKITVPAKKVTTGNGLVGVQIIGEGKNKNGATVRFVAVRLGQPKTPKGAFLIALGAPSAFQAHEKTLLRILNSPKL